MSGRKLDRGDLPTVWAATAEVWRAWLEEYHTTAEGAWLHMYKKATGEPSITWAEAVEQALCFGWIDGQSKSIDERTFRQYFAPRKPGGTWSRKNKETVERLIAADLMHQRGLDAITVAKANGAWERIDSVEAMEVPEDFAEALAANPAAATYIETLSRSARWQLLYWINAAKRPQTRVDRIVQIIQAGNAGKRPDRFIQPKQGDAG